MINCPNSASILGLNAYRDISTHCLGVPLSGSSKIEHFIGVRQVIAALIPIQIYFVVEFIDH